MTTQTLHGVMQGNSIQLTERSTIPTGTQVRIIVIPDALQPALQLPAGEGLRQTYGAWAEDADELDKFIERSRQDRKSERRPQDL